MFSNGPLEIAMTHTVSPDGMRHMCHRPDSIRSIASRLQRWRGEKETCHSCVASDAIVFRSGEALCARCNDERTVRTASVEPLRREQWEPRGEVMRGEGMSGHSIVVNELSLDLGGFRERIMPGALTRTFKETQDVRALWNHNADLTLGRLSANTLSIRQDAKGLFMQLTPPKWASSHMETVGRRDVTGQSFGFMALDDEWFGDGPIPIRHVLDMRVSEVSVVAFPAYPQTNVSVVESMGSRMEFLRRVNRTRRAMNGTTEKV